MSDNGLILGVGDCTLSIANPFDASVVVLTLRDAVNFWNGIGYSRRKIPQTSASYTQFREPAAGRVTGNKEKHAFTFDLQLSDEEKLTLEEIFLAYEQTDNPQIQFADNRQLYVETGVAASRALASGTVEVRPNGYVRYFAQFNLLLQDVQGIFEMSDETLLGDTSSARIDAMTETGPRRPLWRCAFTAIEGEKLTP